MYYAAEEKDFIVDPNIQKGQKMLIMYPLKLLYAKQEKAMAKTDQ